jgi:hypothetical protein
MFNHFVSILHYEHSMPNFKRNSWKNKNVWNFFGKILRRRNGLQFPHILNLAFIPCIIYEKKFITQLDIMLHFGNIKFPA